MELMLAKNHDYDEAWRSMQYQFVYGLDIDEDISYKSKLKVCPVRHWFRKVSTPIIWT